MFSSHSTECNDLFAWRCEDGRSDSCWNRNEDLWLFDHLFCLDDISLSDLSSDTSCEQHLDFRTLIVLGLSVDMINKYLSVDDSCLRYRFSLCSIDGERERERGGKDHKSECNASDSVVSRCPSQFVLWRTTRFPLSLFCLDICPFSRSEILRGRRKEGKKRERERGKEGKRNLLNRRRRRRCYSSWEEI